MAAYEVADALGSAVFVFFLASDDTGVVIHLEHHAAAYPVFLHELLLALFRVHIHTAELIHDKGLAVLSHALLPEKNRTRRLYIYYGSKEQEYYQGQDTAHKSACYVSKALYGKLSCGGSRYAA